jgi:hypothetical protein
VLRLFLEAQEILGEIKVAATIYNCFPQSLPPAMRTPIPNFSLSLYLPLAQSLLLCGLAFHPLRIGGGSPLEPYKKNRRCIDLLVHLAFHEITKSNNNITISMN